MTGNSGNGVGRLWKVIVLTWMVVFALAASGIGYVVSDNAATTSNTVQIQTLKEGLKSIDDKLGKLLTVNRK